MKLNTLKTMLRSRFGYLLLVVALNPVMSVHAEKSVNLHYIGGMSLGYSSFDFPAKLDHELNFPVYQLHGGIAYKKFYVVANIADSFSDVDVSEEEDVGDASRYDRDISLGYQLTSNWGIFAGYKVGKTEIDYLSREDLDDDGSARAREDSYKHEGPFVGFSYSKKFESAGKLTLSFAYADLEATNRFEGDTDDDDDDEIPEFDDLTGTVKGDSTGISYGVRWSIPVAGNLLYFLSYRVNEYEQDLTVDGIRYDDIDETISYLTTGLYFVY